MFANDGNQVQNRRCGGCINPWNHQATPGKTLFAVTIVALAAIATAVGVLSILSALGYNIHVFNVSLKVLGDLTIYGGAAVTFVSFVIFAVGLSWLITRACCRQNRQENNPNNGANDNPGNQPPASIANNNPGNQPPASMRVNEYIPQHQYPGADEDGSSSEEPISTQNVNPKTIAQIETNPNNQETELLNQVAGQVFVSPLAIPGGSGQQPNNIPVENSNKKPNFLRNLEEKEGTPPPVITTHIIQPVKIDNSSLAELTRCRLERLKQRSQAQQQPQQTQNSAPAIQNQSPKPSERLLDLPKKQQAEQSNLSLSNSNNAAQQPVQPLPQRNVREIRRPVIAKTGYEPLDLLKEERVLRNQPQSCPLLETLNNVETTKIKIVDNTNNRFVGTKEEQCIRQRTGFILNMKGKVNEFIGELTHPDQTKTVIAFIMQQNEAFNAQLLQNSVPTIDINAILDQDVIDMWRELLEINQKSCLNELELQVIDKYATREKPPIPEAFRKLFIKISKLPTSDTYVANGIYTRLEKALGFKENTLFAYPIEECVKAFREKLKEDIVSLFERTQQTPLTIVDLEKIKLYIEQEGVDFFRTYNLKIRNEGEFLINTDSQKNNEVEFLTEREFLKYTHQFFMTLYGFANKFQTDVLALFENSKSASLTETDLKGIQLYIEMMKPIIFKKYCLNIDADVVLAEVQKFEQPCRIMFALIRLPLKYEDDSENETLFDNKLQKWVGISHGLPNADDSIWKKYPYILEKINTKISCWTQDLPFTNMEIRYPLKTMQGEFTKNGKRKSDFEEAAILLATKLGCKREELPKIEVDMKEASEKDGEMAQQLQDGEMAQQLQNAFNEEQEQENQGLIAQFLDPELIEEILLYDYYPNDEFN